MTAKDQLKGKRVLAVDDEPDILTALEEILSMCVVEKASSFQEAKRLLETRYFDVVILDIMGVDGYALLEIAQERGMVTVMLTSHALSPESVIKSYDQGASSYVPKEKMPEMATILNEILETLEKGKSPWSRWLYRWVSYFDEKFGPDWKNKDKEFWENFSQWD